MHATAPQLEILAYGQPAAGGYGPPGGDHNAPPPGGYPPQGGGYGPPGGRDAGFGPPGGGYGPPGGGYGPTGGGYGHQGGGHPHDGGYRPSPPTSIAAILGLVAGLLSALSCCCVAPFVSIPGVICSAIGMRATGRGERSGRGMALTGMILNVLSVLAVIGFFALGGMGLKIQLDQAAVETKVVLQKMQNGEAQGVYDNASLAFRSRNLQEFIGLGSDLAALPPVSSVDLDYDRLGDVFGDQSGSGDATFVNFPFVATFGGETRTGFAIYKKLPVGGWLLEDLRLSP